MGEQGLLKEREAVDEGGRENAGELYPCGHLLEVHLPEPPDQVKQVIQRLVLRDRDDRYALAQRIFFQLQPRAQGLLQLLLHGHVYAGCGGRHHVTEAESGQHPELSAVLPTYFLGLLLGSFEATQARAVSPESRQGGLQRQSFGGSKGTPKQTDS